MRRAGARLFEGVALAWMTAFAPLETLATPRIRAKAVLLVLTTRTRRRSQRVPSLPDGRAAESAISLSLTGYRMVIVYGAVLPENVASVAAGEVGVPLTHAEYVGRPVHVAVILVLRSERLFWI
jgi:hypothetical protein